MGSFVPPLHQTAALIDGLGTPAEIDLRFGNKEQGSLQVVVAPIMRFMDEPPEGGVKIEVSSKGLWKMHPTFMTSHSDDVLPS